MLVKKLLFKKNVCSKRTLVKKHCMFKKTFVQENCCSQNTFVQKALVQHNFCSKKETFVQKKKCLNRIFSQQTFVQTIFCSKKLLCPSTTNKQHVGQATAAIGQQETISSTSSGRQWHRLAFAPLTLHGISRTAPWI